MKQQEAPSQLLRQTERAAGDPTFSSSWEISIWVCGLALCDYLWNLSMSSLWILRWYFEAVVKILENWNTTVAHIQIFGGLTWPLKMSMHYSYRQPMYMLQTSLIHMTWLPRVKCKKLGPVCPFLLPKSLPGAHKTRAKDKWLTCILTEQLVSSVDEVKNAGVQRR